MSYDTSFNSIEDKTIQDNLINLYNDKILTQKRTTKVIKRKKEVSTEHIEALEINTNTEDVVKVKKPRKKQEPLKPSYIEDINVLEAGIDEAGRGPLFGRVYSACVILPNDDSFQHHLIKDSKKYSSKKKLLEVYNYIIENAVAYSVCYEDEDVIDNINIRQATLKAMNNTIDNLVWNKKYDFSKKKPDYLLVDGCDFYTKSGIDFICIEGGDNLYTPIAAASILAKVERDKYIEELCHLYPYLEEKYGIESNKGYGTKKHLDGIKAHGITLWHRKTFGICKKFA